MHKEAGVWKRCAVVVLQADVAVAGPQAVEWDGHLPDEVDCLEDSRGRRGGRVAARRAVACGPLLLLLLCALLLRRRRAEVVGRTGRYRVVVEDHEAQDGELREHDGEREALVHETRAATGGRRWRANVRHERQSVRRLATLYRLLRRRAADTGGDVSGALQRPRPELVAIARRPEHLHHKERLDKVAFRSRALRLREVLSADNLQYEL